jgi:hypothetical protein
MDGTWEERATPRAVSVKPGWKRFKVNRYKTEGKNKTLSLLIFFLSGAAIAFFKLHRSAKVLQ